MTSPPHTLPPPSAHLMASLTNDQSARLASKFPGMRGVANCITCGGSGTFRWYAVGSRQMEDVVDYECACIDQFRMHRRFLWSGVMESYQRLSWMDYDDVSSISPIFDYTADAHRLVAAGVGMTIHGDRGNGKTMAANLLAKELVDLGIDCYIGTFASIVDMFADGWTSKDDREWFSSRIRNAGVLLVDDLFRERGGEGEQQNKKAALGERTLEEILRHRVSRAMPTIITMNPDPDKVQAAYGGHVVSLLSERNLVVKVVGEDYRPKVMNRTVFETTHGLVRPIVVR